MYIKIREIERDDAEAFYHLRLEALRSEPEAFAETPVEFSKKSTGDIKKQITSWKQLGAFAFGAFDSENKLTGMAGVYRYPRTKTRHRCKVWGVFVTKNARGLGISRQILNEVIQKAKKSKSIIQLELEVGVDNSAAVQLYKSLGFEVCGVQPRALKVGTEYIDEHLMVLKLK